MSVFLMALWPLFALIVMGALFKRRAFPTADFWSGADRLNYRLLFPALLLSSLAKAPLHDPALGRLALAVGLVLGIGVLLAWGMRYIRRWPAERFGPLVQGSLRFNTYLGLALVGSLQGSEGLAMAAVMLALLVPAVNVISVLAFSSGQGITLRHVLLSLLRNPLILACLGGILINLSGIGLPGGTDRLLALLAATSLPLGLLCVGAALQPGELKAELGTLLANSIVRLLGMPLLAWGVAWGIGLQGMERLLLVVFFALPTAPTAYALTRHMGGDSRLMAGLITLQTLLAALSLPLWLLYLQ